MKKTFMSFIISVLFINCAYSNDTISVFAATSAFEKVAIDLSTGVFNQYGISVRTQSLPWKRALLYMEFGKLDMMLTLFHTDERAKFMDFTIPYVEVPVVVIVAKGKSFPFSKLDDLIGLNGLMVGGASLGEKYDKIAQKLNIEEKVKEEHIIRMLHYGRADYAIGAKYAFLIKAQKIGFEEKIEFLSTPVTSRGLCFAFSKKSPFLKYLPKVNLYIEQRQKDGTLAKMIEEVINSAAR